jgi:hypothetical protein
MIDSSRYWYFTYRSHGLILQEEVDQSKQSVRESDMTGVIFTLVAFVGLPLLAIRSGVDSRTHSSWSPPSDWRERDPRS